MAPPSRRSRGRSWESSATTSQSVDAGQRGATGYFLHSERLGWRCWRADDLPFAIALWGDPAVSRFISAQPFTASDIERRLEREMATQHAHGIQYWPIFLLATGEHVGCCGLRPRESEPDVPEIGFHVASGHWRRGYALEAASRVIGYAFSVRGAKAIFAGHNPHNDASRALLSRLGFLHTHDELYAPTGLQHPSYRLTSEAHAARTPLR